PEARCRCQLEAPPPLDRLRHRRPPDPEQPPAEGVAQVQGDSLHRHRDPRRSHLDGLAPQPCGVHAPALQGGIMEWWSHGVMGWTGRSGCVETNRKGKPPFTAILACALVACLAGFPTNASAQQPVIPVWPGVAPGSESWTQKEVEYLNPQKQQM